MGEARHYLLGIDVGTTAVKGALFAADGEVVAHSSRRYPTARSRHCIVEQAPADWLGAIDAILAELLAAGEGYPIAALGLCSQVNTHVFVDAAGQAVLPAIVWQDGRAALEAASLDRQLSPEQKQAWWGAPVPIDASHPLSRMAWVAAHAPAAWEQTRWVLSPKDYCLLQLTGKVSSDPVSSFGLVDQRGVYVEPLLALVPGAARRLPPLQPMERVLGLTLPERTRGLAVPVVTGTMDAWSNMFGSGVAEVGEGAYFSGTSEIITLVSDRRVATEGVLSFLPVHSWYVHAGPTQSGGDSLRWIADCVGQPVDDVLAQAAVVERSECRLLFLPHLQGERAPLWDPYSRGTFLGIEADTGIGDLALAVMEGVACSARLLYDSVAAAAGRPYPSLYLGGGGSQSELWCQIRADVLNIELHRLHFTDTGVLGAAIIAGAGVGLYDSVPQAARRMVAVERVFQPDPARRQRYDSLLSLYRETYYALQPIYQRING